MAAGSQSCLFPIKILTAAPVCQWPLIPPVKLLVSQSVNFITANVLALLTSLQTQNDRPQRNNNTTFVLNFSKLQTSITNKMAKNLNYFFTVNLKILSSRTKHNIVFCPKYKDKNVMNILRLYFRCHSVVLSHYK